jgi:hypothetical protein
VNAVRIIALLLAAWCGSTAAGGAEDLRVLEATRPVVSIREGGTFRKDVWRLTPELKPDIYEADLPDGRPQRVAFITDVDSVAFTVEEGGQYDFIIRHGDDRCLTRIVGVRVAPMAVFDAAYRKAHRDRITVEVPEVYELVNVAIAMTSTGLADSGLVYHDSDYYRAMRKWFDPFRSHPAIAALDSVLSRSSFRYFSLKMNGYAFEFDRDGRIVPSGIYDRTAFSGERHNSLRPFIPQLQSFADSSGFREFYRLHRSTYAAQAAFYTDTAGVGEMREWLNRNFPGAGGYDSYKIIFSPLVAYNQSATWIESNGFRELQAHVNYPYPADVPRRADGSRLSERAETVVRGDIVFTELNHGYINPEADKYADRVLRAVSRREVWVDSTKGPGYYGGIASFNEYMNWALVSLRFIDLVPREEQPRLFAIIDTMMTKGRGFPQFAAFDAFLIDLYRHRKAGQTVADLYPRIIEWFEERNAAAAAEEAGKG